MSMNAILWIQRKIKAAKIRHSCLSGIHEPDPEINDGNPAEVNCDFWGFYTCQWCRHCGSGYFVQRPQPRVITMTMVLSQGTLTRTRTHRAR
jgi:hypothetical protein